MQAAFAICQNKLTTLPSGLDNWNTSKVENIVRITLNSNKLTSLSPLANWNVSKVTSLTSMCYSYSGTMLTSVILPHWNTKNLTDAYNSFCSCFALTTLDMSYWNMSSVTDAKFFLDNCSKLKFRYARDF